MKDDKDYAMLKEDFDGLLDQIKFLESENAALKSENAALKSKIDNGLRVHAIYQKEYDNYRCEPMTMIKNATLILNDYEIGNEGWIGNEI